MIGCLKKLDLLVKEKAVLVRDTLDNIHIITKHDILEAFTK